MPFATPDEISYELAVAAYAGTSWTPKQRADQIRTEYAERLNQVHARLTAKAKTPAQRQAVAAALIDLKRRYRAAFVAWLSARSGTTSWAITGRSGRNERREQKKMATEDRRSNEANAVFARGVKRAEKALDAQRIADAGGPIGVAQRKLEDLQTFRALMKKANAIVRKKGLSDEARIAAMVQAGLSKTAAQSALEPDYAGRKGFPAYELQNTLAETKRLQARIEELRKREAAADAQSTAGEVPEYSFSGGTVELDAEDNRLRIHFDAKPAADVIAKLKSRGFRWSRRHGAWQRQLTDAAKRAAQEITGVQFVSAQAPAGGTCRGADGRFLPNVTCGLPAPAPHEPCRDKEGRFVPVPACTGRKTQVGLAGVSGLAVAFRRGWSKGW